MNCIRCGESSGKDIVCAKCDLYLDKITGPNAVKASIKILDGLLDVGRWQALDDAELAKIWRDAMIN